MHTHERLLVHSFIQSHRPIARTQAHQVKQELHVYKQACCNMFCGSEKSKCYLQNFHTNVHAQ